MQVLKLLKGKIIVSVQAMPNEPFYKEECMLAMMKSVLKGNPAGLRVAGIRDVKMAKALNADLPVIGITKPDVIPANFKSLVYITPSIADVVSLANAGADIIAFDGTTRKRPGGDNLRNIIKFIKLNKKVAMADISTFEEGVNARLLGADIVSTTLAGYTTQSDTTSTEPDFELLEKLVKNLDCPVILEGKVWEIEQVKKAFKLGAHSVVIGSAITRPQLITKRFVGWEKN